MPRLRTIVVVLAVAALGAALAIPALAHSPRAHAATHRKTIRVGDEYFSPKKITLYKNTRVKFHWNADNGESHDVKLVSAPHGVHKFHSDIETADFDYRKTFKTPGTYKLICTIHPNVMKLTIKIRH